MAKSHTPTHSPNVPKSVPSLIPNPQPPKPSYPPLSDPGKRTGFGDKKGGGPGTNNTGAKK